MCPDRDGGISPSFSSSRGWPGPGVRRLPPRGALTARLLCTLGVLCLLISLPMKGGYGLWNREPYSTWEGIITLSRAALFFPLLLPPLIPFPTLSPPLRSGLSEPGEAGVRVTRFAPTIPCPSVNPNLQA